MPNYVPISSQHHWNLEELMEKIWEWVALVFVAVVILLRFTVHCCVSLCEYVLWSWLHIGSRNDLGSPIPSISNTTHPLPPLSPVHTVDVTCSEYTLNPKDRYPTTMIPLFYTPIDPPSKRSATDCTRTSSIRSPMRWFGDGTLSISRIGVGMTTFLWTRISCSCVKSGGLDTKYENEYTVEEEWMEWQGSSFLFVCSLGMTRETYRVIPIITPRVRLFCKSE
jgi:hypothetical protein